MLGDSSHDPYLFTHTGQKGYYTALSHCWGDHSLGKTLKTTFANIRHHMERLDLEALPLTFRDAIEVARGLDLQYLWIDSLCIIQDSKDDWEIEASRMSGIYRDAYIVLAADLGPYSDAGLFHRSTTEAKLAQARSVSHVTDDGISHQIFVRRNWPFRYEYLRGHSSMRLCYAPEWASNLDIRGWVLQERLLATRTVHFTNAEMIWECSTVFQCSCGIPIHTPSPRRYFNHDRRQDSIQPTSEILAWQSVIEEFSVRNLTFPTDRLPAVSGLANAMHYKVDDYFAGLWRKNLERELMWVNPVGHISWAADTREDLNKSRKTRNKPSGRITADEGYAPSWSWASISASVTHNLESLKDVVPEWIVKDVHCVTITKNPFGPVSRESYLDIESLIFSASLEECDVAAASIAPRYQGRACVELCIVRDDQKFAGRNKTWFDAGIEGQEWNLPGKVSVIIVGVRSTDKVPVGLILMGEDTTFMRIGMVRLDNWAGKDWSTGGTRRTVKIR